MNMCLPKFEFYHKLNQTQTLNDLIFLKQFLSGVRSKIHHVRRNILSTGQSV